MNDAHMRGLRAAHDQRREREKAARAELAGLIERVVHSGLWSYVDEEASFSWCGCEYCTMTSADGRRLGADVYTVEGYETLEESKADAESGRDDNAHTFNLCGECIYTLTYGEG